MKQTLHSNHTGGARSTSGDVNSFASRHTRSKSPSKLQDWDGRRGGLWMQRMLWQTLREVVVCFIGTNYDSFFWVRTPQEWSSARQWSITTYVSEKCVNLNTGYFILSTINPHLWYDVILYMAIPHGPLESPSEILLEDSCTRYSSVRK